MPVISVSGRQVRCGASRHRSPGPAGGLGPAPVLRSGRRHRHRRSRRRTARSSPSEITSWASVSCRQAIRQQAVAASGKAWSTGPVEGTSPLAAVLAEVGPRLRRVRDERGLTLMELSEATGISKSTAVAARVRPAQADRRAPAPPSPTATSRWVAGRSLMLDTAVPHRSAAAGAPVGRAAQPPRAVRRADAPARRVPSPDTWRVTATDPAGVGAPAAGDEAAPAPPAAHPHRPSPARRPRRAQPSASAHPGLGPGRVRQDDPRGRVVRRGEGTAWLSLDPR